MNHTAYDIRFLANNVNREKFNDVFGAIEDAAATGAYQLTVNVKKLKLIERTNLTGMLTNLGFEVRSDATTNELFVSWMEKEKSATK